jgi:hypothetical protein
MRLSLAALLACLLCSSARASSTDWDWLTQHKTFNLHYGQLAIHPFYKLSETYDSNIFLVPPDQPGVGQVGGGIVSSWITKNEFGVETHLPWNHVNSLDLGYGFESDVYTTLPAVNNTINQALHGDYVREGTHGMTYKAGDQYVNTTDQAFSQLIQRARRWMNRAYVEADYVQPNGRLAWGVNADHQRDKYVDPTLGALLDRYQEDFGGNIGYMVQPKTKVYVSYLRSIIHYSVDPAAGPDNDNKSHTFAGGVTGQISPKVTGKIEVGDTYRYYDAVIAGQPQIYNTPVVTTSLRWDADKYTFANLTVSRSFQESIDASNAFYYDNNATLNLQHRFPHKFAAGIDLSVELDQYDNTQTFLTTTGTRRDDLYQYGVWVQYDIQQWLSTGLAYIYRERDSTFSGQFNYTDSQVVWNAAFKF